MLVVVFLLVLVLVLVLLLVVVLMLVFVLVLLLVLLLLLLPLPLLLLRACVTILIASATPSPPTSDAGHGREPPSGPCWETLLGGALLGAPPRRVCQCPPMCHLAPLPRELLHAAELGHVFDVLHRRAGPPPTPLSKSDVVLLAGSGGAFCSMQHTKNLT